jgi:hypothetical protein
METRIVQELNPVWVEMYMQALRGNGLDVYGKEVNIDGWIRGTDLFLVFTDPAEVSRARRVIAMLEKPLADAQHEGCDLQVPDDPEHRL